VGRQLDVAEDKRAARDVAPSRASMIDTENAGYVRYEIDERGGDCAGSGFQKAGDGCKSAKRS
jgi:hypothetical protein